MLKEEEDRLEKSRQNELIDYEETLTKQYEAELRRKQQSLALAKEQEEKELELMKLRID
jgi:hypothetical protein